MKTPFLRITALALLLFALVACETPFKKKDTTTTVTPAGETKNAELGNAATDEIEAAKKAEAARIAEQSKIIASVRAAKFAAAHVTAPEDLKAQKAIVDELLLAEKTSTVIATAEDERDAMERVALNLAGRVEEADARYKNAEQRAQEEKVRTVKAEGERDEARRAVDTAKEEARKEREEQARIYQARLDALKKIADDAQNAAAAAEDEANRKQKEKWDNYLRWGLLACSFLCGLGAVATMWVSKGTQWERAALAAGGAASFGVCYWALNQWWFQWALRITVLGALIAVVWYVWTEVKERKKKEQLRQSLEEQAREAGLLRGTAKKFIARLDKVKGKPMSASDWELWLKDLRGDMEQHERDVVHKLRAEVNVSS